VPSASPQSAFGNRHSAFSSDSRPSPHNQFIVIRLADSDFFGADAGGGEAGAFVALDGGGVLGGDHEANDADVAGATPAEGVIDHFLAEFLAAILWADIDAPKAGGVAAFGAFVAPDADHTGEVGSGVGEDDAAVGVVHGLLDALDPDGIGMEQVFVVIGAECVGMKPQGFEAQGFEREQIGFAHQTNGDIGGCIGHLRKDAENFCGGDLNHGRLSHLKVRLDRSPGRFGF